jgi:Fe-S cluster biogenesis protein NfuA
MPDPTVRIFTEITPNPRTLKFVTNRVLMPVGSADFPIPQAAGALADPALPKTLFGIGGVQGVFISGDFVTITKKDDSPWEQVVPEVAEALGKYLEQGVPVLPGIEAKEVGPMSEVERRIRQILDDQIRPSVAMDGGDIIFHGFEDGIVKLHMQGSCSSCPSSTATLKMGIENLLKEEIPEVREVQSV